MSDELGLLGTRGTARSPETRLYADGIVIGHHGPVIVPPHSDFQRIPGTAYLDPSSGTLDGAVQPDVSDVEAAREALDGSGLPGQDSVYANMGRQALLDISALVHDNGAAVTAANPYWRYVWPRDAGFMAAALSLVGCHALARRLVAYLSRMQEPDGTWQARYLPDGSGNVPDDRGLQHDGLGWALWAAWVDWQLSTEAPTSDVSRMVTRAVAACLELVDTNSGLPRPSQDYWETDIAEITLGVAAPVLLALRTGGQLLEAEGLSNDVSAAASSARGLEEAITDAFGRHDYTRRVGGQGGLDASVAFLLPPFASAVDKVVGAWRHAVRKTTTANGGVRPGEEWPDLQTAWTPQVSLHALTAASLGETALAHRLLSWLDVRRTRLGALPEKVTAHGHPAAVAPLGLTSATVLLALGALDGRHLPIPITRPEPPASTTSLREHRTPREGAST